MSTYDHCLIFSFLKTLCTKNHKEKNPFGFIIHSTVKEIKNYLQKLPVNQAVEISPDYLDSLEKLLPGVGFRYVVIHQDNVPVFFAYYQLHTLTSKNFNLNDDKRRFVKGILNFFLKLKKVKVLVLGNALRNETQNYYFDPAIFTYQEAVEALVGAAEKIAADEYATTVVLKDIPEAFSSKEQFIALNQYQSPWDDKVMEMPIEQNWNTLQDYLATLTRKYKSRANKIISTGKKLTVTELSESQVLEHQQEIHQLFTEVIEKQAFVITRPEAGYFTDLKRLYKDTFEVTAYFHEGRIVAFYSAFVTAETYEIYYVGFDYQLNNEYQLYFNMLFAGLERSILLKKKLLKLGRTSFDAKASLGALPKNLPYGIKMENTPDFVMNWFICYFSTMEDARWKQRNPLKNRQPASPEVNLHESFELTDSLA